MPFVTLQPLQTKALFLKFAILVAFVDRATHASFAVDFQQTFGVYRQLNLDLFSDEQFAYARQHDDAVKQILRSFVVSGAALNRMMGFCEALDLDHHAIPELPYDKLEASQQVLANLLYGVAALIQQQAGTSDTVRLADPDRRRRCLLNSCAVIANDHQPEIDALTFDDKRSIGIELIGLASIAGAMSDSAQTLIVEIDNRLDLYSVTEAAEIQVKQVGRRDLFPRPPERTVPITSEARDVRRLHHPQYPLRGRDYTFALRTLNRPM